MININDYIKSSFACGCGYTHALDAKDVALSENGIETLSKLLSQIVSKPVKNCSSKARAEKSDAIEIADKNASLWVCDNSAEAKSHKGSGVTGKLKTSDRAEKSDATEIADKNTLSADLNCGLNVANGNRDGAGRDSCIVIVGRDTPDGYADKVIACIPHGLRRVKVTFTSPYFTLKNASRIAEKLDFARVVISLSDRAAVDTAKYLASLRDDVVHIAVSVSAAHKTFLAPVSLLRKTGGFSLLPTKTPDYLIFDVDKAYSLGSEEAARGFYSMSVLRADIFASTFGFAAGYSGYCEFLSSALMTAAREAEDAAVGLSLGNKDAFRSLFAASLLVNVVAAYSFASSGDISDVSRDKRVRPVSPCLSILGFYLALDRINEVAVAGIEISGVNTAKADSAKADHSGVGTSNVSPVSPNKTAGGEKSRTRCENERGAFRKRLRFAEIERIGFDLLTKIFSAYFSAGITAPLLAPDDAETADRMKRLFSADESAYLRGVADRHRANEAQTEARVAEYREDLMLSAADSEQKLPALSRASRRICRTAFVGYDACAGGEKEIVGGNGGRGVFSADELRLALSLSTEVFSERGLGIMEYLRERGAFGC